MKRYRRCTVCLTCEKPLTFSQEAQSGCCPYCGALAVKGYVPTKLKAVPTDYGLGLLIASCIVSIVIFVIYNLSSSTGAALR
jgi:hypothetical protein